VAGLSFSGAPAAWARSAGEGPPQLGWLRSLVAEPLGLPKLTANKVDSMERKGTTTKPDQARVAAETISQIMAGTLFGAPPGSLKSKQDKPDTAHGWPTAQAFAAGGVPYATFLHRRAPGPGSG
jgi:hypothetical protein